MRPRRGLTRRASKHSRLRAVVVKWSHLPLCHRYERQGILVEPATIETALEECLADEELREERRRREALRRERVDHEYVGAFADQISI